MNIFFRFFSDALDYMYPKKKFKKPPGQTISAYKMSPDVGEQERLLMLTNKARSPQAARALLKQYNVSTAAEVIKLLPKKRGLSFRARLASLLKRLDGHNPDDPYRIHSEMNNRNRLRGRYDR